MPLQEEQNNMAPQAKSQSRGLNTQAARQPPPPRATTPKPNSGRGRSQDRQTGERRKSLPSEQNKENRRPLSRTEASSLKLPIMTTMPNAPKQKTKLNQSTTRHDLLEESSKPEGRQNLYSASMREPQEQKGGTFDDHSMSFDMDMDSYGEVALPADFYSVGPNRNMAQSHNGLVFAQHTNLYPQAFQDDEHGPPQFSDAIGAEIDAERSLHGLPPKFDHHQDYDDGDYEDDIDDEFEQDANGEEQTAVLVETPSRTRFVQGRAAAGHLDPKAIKQEPTSQQQTNTSLNLKHSKAKSDVPLAIASETSLQEQQKRFGVGVDLDAHLGRFKPQQPRQQSHMAPYRPPQPRSAQDPNSLAFGSKASSFGEVSEEDEEQPISPPVLEPAPTGTKRPLPVEECDYDLEELRTKSMAELEQIPFLDDPRHPTQAQAVDANGQPLSLSTKLYNLSKMQDDDRTTLFKSLTDVERAETADWFLERFHADMAKLTAIRVERRKIALRYEMEVKKREKLVRVKVADVQEELNGLKRGGQELVRDRGRSPSKALD